MSNNYVREFSSVNKDTSAITTECSLEKIKKSIVSKDFDIPVSAKTSVIAVIDTGVDFSNKEIKNNLFLPKKYHMKNSLNFGINTTKSEISTEPHDYHGHGTHIIGLILSINKNVKIIPFNYYDPSRSGYDNVKSFNKAIEIAIDMGVDIINISGGGPEFLRKEKRILDKAQKKGIIVVSAMGNERNNTEIYPYYPANYNMNNIVSVMSHDSDYKKSYFSNWGKNATISSIGEQVMSFGLNHSNCVKLNGTSQSTAVATGFISLLYGDKEFDHNKIKQNLLKFTKLSKNSDLARPIDFQAIISYLNHK